MLAYSWVSRHRLCSNCCVYPHRPTMPCAGSPCMSQMRGQSSRVPGCASPCADEPQLHLGCKCLLRLGQANMPLCCSRQQRLPNARAALKQDCQPSAVASPHRTCLWDSLSQLQGSCLGLPRPPHAPRRTMMMGLIQGMQWGSSLALCRSSQAQEAAREQPTPQNLVCHRGPGAAGQISAGRAVRVCQVGPCDACCTASQSSDMC